MNDLGWWKIACVVFVLWAVTVIASRAQDFTTMLSFNGVDGASPRFTSLVQSLDGSFYGTTSTGGVNSAGTVFTITAEGILTTLYSFCSQPDCIDGSYPLSGLILATDGYFYGTTEFGGMNGDGAVFRVTKTGVLTTLHSFNGADGNKPWAPLIQASDGSFYGTTYAGGSGSRCPGGCGTIFKITHAGLLTTLHSLDATDGLYPSAPLIEATNGRLFGTTLGGGKIHGTIFKITRAGQFTNLHRFNGLDGTFPGGLFQAADGNLYGTTQEGGGVNNGGTVFKITPGGGAFSTLYIFCQQEGCPDGSGSFAPLLQATDGNLYGTTYGGGANKGGTVFDMTLTGALTTLHSFDGSDGDAPAGGLLQATTGVLYGTTFAGGTWNQGAVFSLDVAVGPFVTFVHDSGKVGQSSEILGQGLTGTTNVSFNGTPASFTVVSDTLIKATIPAGATTGYVTVATPSGTLTSNVPFHVIK